MTGRVVHVIGGGLAGAEASWQLALDGIPVVLHEMRPVVATPAHITSDFAELVCSNSFRALDIFSAIGLLHEEMRCSNSLILKHSDDHKVPAGGALAVDRIAFSKAVTSSLVSHELISISREEVKFIPNDWDNVIIATGPLTSSNLTDYIVSITGEDNLFFFDAISPIVMADSIDFSKAWLQSRYDKGSNQDEKKAYLNCPMTKEQYYSFIDALLSAQVKSFHEWEKVPFFEGCLPIEVMAQRGVETLRYGPMKPVGLTNPHDPDNRPYAVVQLRKENKLGKLYNLVGFQTKMTYEAQNRVLRLIPGLENADFERLGGVHRNTFIKSPLLLDNFLRLKNMLNIRCAGQITGVEGYIESAAIGLMAGKFAAADYYGRELVSPNDCTAMGSLLHHITAGSSAENFQPMNINFGLFPSLDQSPKGRKGKKYRAEMYSLRALEGLKKWPGACQEKVEHAKKKLSMPRKS